MIDQIVVVLAFAAALGSGVVGGIFYAFSSFIMAALRRIPAEQGTNAMNAINVTVINPSFMLMFMGTALLSVILGGAAFLWWGEASRKLLLAASLVYLLGSLSVTMVFNVPLNDQLAAVGPARASALWSRYLDVWTGWNHVRTLACIVSAILFTAAL